MNRQTKMMLVVLFGFMSVISYGEQDIRALNWERAAINYESAALCQLEMAANIKDTTADTYMTAGNLILSAAANYDKSANCWRRAATNSSDDIEKKLFISNSKENVDQATKLIKRAIERFESILYQFSNTNNLQIQINLNLKIAGLRERVAQR